MFSVSFLTWWSSKVGREAILQPAPPMFGHIFDGHNQGGAIGLSGYRRQSCWSVSYSTRAVPTTKNHPAPNAKSVDMTNPVLVGFRHVMVPVPQARMHSPVKFHRLSPKEHSDWTLSRWDASSVCYLCWQGLLGCLLFFEKQKNDSAKVHLWKEEVL